MLSDVKVIAVSGDSYAVELRDSDLGSKQVCFHMPYFDQAAFDRIVLHLHEKWIAEGNTPPEPKPEINIERIKASMDQPVVKVPVVEAPVVEVTDEPIV